ncbi:hypothetical protein cyc_03769 [Cyclospora cayetanensis]|uniref:Uncharacterized protein n=1 Tax=Cyclospora cayetanensis TaxID=88456 RepID=A0A1D3CY25_9EIME|nr:hypothetical protein cyc_03769 [Cyclospora cayetanensis]
MEAAAAGDPSEPLRPEELMPAFFEGSLAPDLRVTTAEGAASAGAADARPGARWATMPPQNAEEAAAESAAASSDDTMARSLDGASVELAEVYRLLETALQHFVEERPHKVLSQMQQVRKLQRSAWSAYLISAAAHQLLTEAARLHICTAYCSSDDSKVNKHQAAALEFDRFAETRDRSLRDCGLLQLGGQPRLFLQQQRILQSMPAELRQDVVVHVEELRLQLHAVLPPLRACTQRSAQLKEKEQELLLLATQQQQQKRARGSSSKGCGDSGSRKMEALHSSNRTLCCTDTTKQQLSTRLLWRCALLLRLQQMREERCSSTDSNWEALLLLPFGSLVAAVLQQPEGTLSLVDCLHRAAGLLSEHTQQSQQEFPHAHDDEPRGDLAEIEECYAWRQALSCLLDASMALLLPRIAGSNKNSLGECTDADAFVRLLLQPSEDCPLGVKAVREDGSVCCAACDGLVAVLQRQLAAAAAALPAFPLLQQQTQEAMKGKHLDSRKERLQLECLCAAFRACEAVIRFCALLRPSPSLLRLVTARQVEAFPSTGVAAIAAVGQVLKPAQQKALQRVLLLQQDAQARVLCRARIVEDTAAFLKSGGCPKVATQQEASEFLDAADAWGGLLPGQLQRQLLDPPLTMGVLLQRMQRSPALMESVVAFLSLALVNDPSVWKEAVTAAALPPTDRTGSGAVGAAAAAADDKVADRHALEGPWGLPARRNAVGFLAALAWLPPSALRLCLFHVRWMVLLLLGVYHAMQLGEQHTVTGAAWIEILQSHTIDLETQEVLIPIESTGECAESALDVVYRELVAVSENESKAASLATAPCLCKRSSTTRRSKRQPLLRTRVSGGEAFVGIYGAGWFPSEEPLPPSELLPKVLQQQLLLLKQQGAGGLTCCAGLSVTSFTAFWRLVFEADKALWLAVADAQNDGSESRTNYSYPAAAAVEASSQASIAATPPLDGNLALRACLLLRTLFYELVSQYGPAILAIPPASPPDESVLSAAAEVQKHLPQHVLLLLQHYVATNQQRNIRPAAAHSEAP